MVFAEDIRKTILKLAKERGSYKTLSYSEVARAIDHENWRNLMEAVRLVADILIREGKIVVSHPEKKINIFNVKSPNSLKKL